MMADHSEDGKISFGKKKEFLSFLKVTMVSDTTGAETSDSD